MVIILVGVFFLVGGSSSNLLSSYDTCSGGTILSVDDVSITSSNDLGGQKVVRVLFDSLTTGECLDIKVTESDLEDLQDDGFEVQDGIVGDIEITKKQQEFDLLKNTDKYFKLITKDIGNSLTKSPSNCGQEDGLNLLGGYYQLGLFGNRVICVYGEEQGTGGRILSGSSLLWETKVSIGGRSTTLNNNILESNIGSIASVKWAGNGLGSSLLDNPDYDLFFDYTKNKFLLIDEGTYNIVNREFHDVLSNLGAGYAIRASVANQWIINYNNNLEQFTKDKFNEWVDDEPLVGSVTADENKLIVDLNSNVIYPKFTLDILAEEVGIFQTTGKPKVTCPSGSISLNSGDTKVVSASLKNEGGSSASFGYYVECNDGSYSVSPDAPQTIGSGSSKTIRITLGNLVSEGTERTNCKFEAYSFNGNDRDTCYFEFDSTFTSSCHEGEKSCEDSNTKLYTCDDVGTYDITNCEFGCESYGTDYRCKLSDEICNNGRDDDGDSLIDKDDPDCKKPNFWDAIKQFFADLFAGTINFLKLLKYMVIGVLSIVTLFVSSDLLKKIESLEKLNIVRWIVSVGIGVGVFFLALSFIGSFLYWVVVIGLVVYLLFGKKIVGLFQRK